MVSKTNMPRCSRNSTVPFFIVVPIKFLLALDSPRDKYEIIVSDGHSMDRTATIASSYGVITLEDNGGCRAYGCNMGHGH